MDFAVNKVVNGLLFWEHKGLDIINRCVWLNGLSLTLVSIKMSWSLYQAVRTLFSCVRGEQAPEFWCCVICVNCYSRSDDNLEHLSRRPGSRMLVTHKYFSLIASCVLVLLSSMQKYSSINESQGWTVRSNNLRLKHILSFLFLEK